MVRMRYIKNGGCYEKNKCSNPPRFLLFCVYNKSVGEKKSTGFVNVSPHSTEDGE